MEKFLLWLASLFMLPSKGEPKEYPWITKGLEAFGKHEVTDKEWLKSWLKSDGKALGDPTALPWCGDFVETAVVLALPDERLSAPLNTNPYWARNWLLFGDKIAETRGAIAIFSRESGGHVAILVGKDATHYYVLGGNQGNTVNVSRIAKNRCLGLRWPSTYPQPKVANIPLMTPGTIPTSANEV